MTKVCAISDLHGLPPKDFTIEKCDILAIAGDIMNLYVQRHFSNSYDWVKSDFIPWVTSLPAKDVVIVAGNHDFFLESGEEEFREMIEGTNIHYLCNETKVIQGLRIYGTPICHQFFNWAFMPPDDVAREIFNKVNEDPVIDLMVCHDAPYGYSDTLLQPGCYKKNIGSRPLRELIARVQPRYVVHGHLHSTNHDVEVLSSSRIFNVSLVNEDYIYAFDPLYLEIKPWDEMTSKEREKWENGPIEHAVEPYAYYDQI